jgi:hypothetical protein
LTRTASRNVWHLRTAQPEAHIGRRSPDISFSDLLHGAEVKMPPQFGTFKQAQRMKEEQGAQLAFDVE